jgi:CRP-like cAMP-binding protein
MSSVNDYRTKLLKDTVLLREGEPGTEFFLLETGVVDIFIQERKIGTLDAGQNQEFIGEVAALLGGNRTATIIAVTDCSLLRIPQMKLEAILSNSPSLGMKLIKSLCRKLSLSAQQHTKFQAQQQSLLKSGNTETSLKNYMKGLLHLMEMAEQDPSGVCAKQAAEYFRSTNPWKIQLGDETMMLQPPSDNLPSSESPNDPQTDISLPPTN